MGKVELSSSDNKVRAKLTKLRGDDTETAFAKRLGISQSTLNRILGGKQSASVGLLDRMAKRLKISIGDFFR